MTSTPGFPYYMCSTNREVNILDLYKRVSDLLISWRDNPLVLNREYAMQYFSEQRTVPVTAFPKGEATKIDKIVRLIFGGSLVMNVIERILFGDYLEAVKNTWRTNAHKVGMDFNTPEGCEEVMLCLENLYRKAKSRGKVLLSDDIQGWEWQDREWMHSAWVDSFKENCVLNLDAVGSSLYDSYAAASSMSPVVHDDGEVILTPDHIMTSGKLTTHLQNSDQRSALAMIDGKTSDPFDNITNGDDCLFICDKSDAIFRTFESSRYGFVHTDVQIENGREFHFSSQVFWRDTDGVARRRPDGLSKMVYNMLTCETREQLYSIAFNALNHPGWSAIEELARIISASLVR